MSIQEEVARVVERLLAYAKDQGGWHNIDETCETAADLLTRISAQLAEVTAEVVRLRAAIRALNFEYHDRWP